MNVTTYCKVLCHAKCPFSIIYYKVDLVYIVLYYYTHTINRIKLNLPF